MRIILNIGVTGSGGGRGTWGRGVGLPLSSPVINNESEGLACAKFPRFCAAKIAAVA